MQEGIKELVGMEMVSVRQIDNNEILFEAASGREFVLYHAQDCCEAVWIEDVCGDLSDLVGSPILLAEESVGDYKPDLEWTAHDTWKAMATEVEDDDCYDESTTWTFYKFGTINGSVTMRWCGTSNGYYSESVDFEERTK